jgi:DNA-binding response OmpR family regulator
MARVYITDDDADIRRLLTLTLVEEGYEVLALKDGRAAIDAVTQEPPDVLVLDLMMPEVDGYQVLEALAQKGLRGSVRVLMLTARSTERDRLEGLEHGADLYLTKPFEPDELTAEVRWLIEATQGQLDARRVGESDTAHLLDQIESVFDKP